MACKTLRERGPPSRCSIGRTPAGRDIDNRDGACARPLQFNERGDLLLQSRGHDLTGGFGERQFIPMKIWALAHERRLIERLQDRYVMFGEWAYAKRSVWYDRLPHYLNVEIDLAARRVRRGGEDVHLTPIEYRLLSHLIGHAGKVLTHRQLLRAVWGPSHVEQNHYLRVYMGNLRQKLEAEPASPKHLLTETGVGYRLMP